MRAASIGRSLAVPLLAGLSSALAGVSAISAQVVPVELSSGVIRSPVPWTIEQVEVVITEEFTPEARASYHVGARLEADYEAMRAFRPGYSFWQHIFSIPDGSVAYGSAEDGRLLAVFPDRGNWAQGGDWHEPGLAVSLAGVRLETNMSSRRDQVALLMEPVVGAVINNPTRGLFLLPNAERYGGFLGEWGAIFERFGVPAEIGLAQAVLESGLDGRVRSEARALGFCQWLEANWNRMKRYSPTVIEGYNQTTQAPYCAAYLSILATKYGTFVPALSEHHAGGTNVGRTVILGELLGGRGTRERYLLGSDFAFDLREISAQRYSDVVRTYGPRSYRYSEMVFGNTITVRNLLDGIPQEQVYAMRAPRSLTIDAISRTTGLSRDEIQRFNPALVREVPANANLYLPRYNADFGPDVSFWHRPADPEYAVVLNDFVRLSVPPESWDEPEFGYVLRDFQARFRATGSEEGDVMATVLEYVFDETQRSQRSAILADYRSSPRIQSLIDRGIQERATLLRNVSTPVR